MKNKKNEKATRQVEVYVGESNGDSCGFWNTMYVEIPKNTPRRLIGKVATRKAANDLDKAGRECCFIGVFNIPPIED